MIEFFNFSIASGTFESSASGQNNLEPAFKTELPVMKTIVLLA